MENNRTYLLRTEIIKRHLNNHFCQHCGVKTSTVTPSFCCVFNISLSCNNNIPSFIGNLWWVLLLGNHLKQIYTSILLEVIIPCHSENHTLLGKHGRCFLWTKKFFTPESIPWRNVIFLVWCSSHIWGIQVCFIVIF